MTGLRSILPAGWKSSLPALLLLCASGLGGLRSWESVAVFSGLFFVCLIFLNEEFSVSGLGVWGVLALWLAAGLAFSPEPLNSFYFFSRYLLMLAFFVFAARGGTRARGAWAGSVFLLGAIAALLSVSEAVMGLPPGGIIGINPNYSSAFIAAALAGSAAVLASAENKKQKIYAVAALLWFSGGLLASNSRGGMLAALAAVLYVLWSVKAWRYMAGILAGAVLLAALATREQFWWFLKLDDPYSLERVRIWGTALNAIFANPVFGAGLGLFERVFEAFKFPFYNGISHYGHSTLHAHSEPLNLAAEAGIPAACLFIWGWWRALSARGEGDPLAAVLKVFLVTLFVQASVDIIFYSGALQLFFFGTLGLLAAGEDRRVDPAGARIRTLSVLLIVLCASFLLRSGFARARSCALDGAALLSAREACFKKAFLFSGGDTDLLGASLPVSLAAHGNYAHTAALAAGASVLRPRDPFPVFLRAQAFYMAGAAAEAKEEFYRVLNLEPGFLGARLRLAEILASEKNYTAAASELLRIETELAKKSAARTAYDLGLRELPEAPYAALRLSLKKQLKRR